MKQEPSDDLVADDAFLDQNLDGFVQWIEASDADYDQLLVSITRSTGFSTRRLPGNLE